MNLLFLAAFASAVACMTVANVYFNDIYNETNPLLPPEKRIIWYRARWSADVIIREHRRLFPTSRKRRVMTIFAIIGFALFFGSVGIIIFKGSLTKVT